LARIIFDTAMTARCWRCCADDCRGKWRRERSKVKSWFTGEHWVS